MSDATVPATPSAAGVWPSGPAWLRGFSLSLALLAALAPLEFRQALPLHGLSFTLPELLAILTASTGLGAWISSGRAAAWRGQVRQDSAQRWIALTLVAWAAWHLGSAVWAPDDPYSGASAHGYVLKFALRVAGSVSLAWFVWQLGAEPLVRRALKVGLLIGLATITVIALFERGLGQEMEPFLKYFRDEPTWMLGEQRLSTVFYHANTQAAYFELVAPLLAVLAARPGQPLWQRLLWVAWLGLLAVLLSLTYSRAGFLAALAGMGLLAYAAPRTGWGLTLRWLALGYGVVVIAAYALNPDMRARVGLTDRSYQVKWRAEQACVGYAGDVVDIPMHLRNTGEWPLSNRQAPGLVLHLFVTLDGQPLSRVWSLTPLPDLPPGVATDMSLSVRLPSTPGTYALVADIGRDRVLRLSSLGNPMLSLQCVAGRPGTDLSRFRGDAVHAAVDLSQVRLTRPTELERPQYWRAAILLWSRHPWLGWGDDRFRQLYHEYVPPSAWDDRARAHSWLLETLVDLGGLGALLLVALLVVAAARVRRLLQIPDTNGEMPAAGLALAAAAGLIGLAVHLQVDYFLAYTQVALLFWLLLGLTLRSGSESDARPNVPREMP